MPSPPPENLAQSPSSQLLWAATAVAAVIVAAYAQVLTCTFGIMDDYSFLYHAIIGHPGTREILMSAGRPLNAFTLDSGFRWAQSIERLTVLRGITLLGMWMLGCSLYAFARQAQLSFPAAVFLACGIVLLPSFQVYAAWAQHFTTPYAGLLAVGSAAILLPDSVVRQRSRYGAIALASLLLAAAIMIYQPVAMLFCTCILIALFAQPKQILGWLKSRLVDVCVTFLVAMLCGFIAFKIGCHYYPMSVDRYSLLVDVPGKISWFISQPLTNATALFAILPNGSARNASLLVLLLGAICFVRRHDRQTSLAAGAAVLVGIVGSYLPNLATAENWGSYRSIGALAATMLVLCLFCVSEIWQTVRPFLLARFGNFNAQHAWLVPTAILLLLTVRAQSNVLNGLVLPNVTEINNLASFLNKTPRDQLSTTEYVVKPAPWFESAVLPIAYDEFGMHSSLREYYARAMMTIVLHETQRIPYGIVIDVPERELPPAVDGIERVTVDFPKLVTSHRFLRR
jgi:hypothetical protein